MARLTPSSSAPAGLTPLDILLGVTVALVWGMGFVFAKAAIAHFPPILLMAFRFSVTALALVWFVRIPRGQLLALFAIAFVAAGFQYGLTFTGLKQLDAGAAALIVQLEVPFLVIIGALFLGEAPGWRKWIGIALAFVGVWYISGAPRIASEWPSVLMVIGGAFFWAVGQAMIRRLERIDGLTVTAWIAVMATPQLFLGSLLVERDQVAAIANAGPVVWLAVLYLGLVMTAFGYGLWNTLLRRNPVSQVAPFLLLLPLFALVGGVVFLGEDPGPQTLIGGALVIGGVGFILFSRD
ncbi:EamA family transporter [Roseovarius sp. SCSIO 43702]|uniref:DMT family transporter n=1 Tax=Roseovarius sp. SCSIO 43702 TaxID=2823043 RepID=UPI001C7379EB|nr:EamA family transporter [Roseovarius sp. SCSIO 43702]QYX56661.1 EamA family transporter [Roseovarius sp. SCSIO 43702]